MDWGKWVAVMESPPLMELVESWDEEQRTGRPGYPRRALIGVVLLKTLYRIPCREGLELLATDPELREVAGVTADSEIPSVHAVSRFTKRWKAFAQDMGLNPDPACPHGHEWTKANTYYGSHGRQCRACKREYWRWRFGVNANTGRRPKALVQLLREQHNAMMSDKHDGKGWVDVDREGRTGQSVSARRERSIEAYQELGARRLLGKIGIESPGSSGG